MKMLKNNKKGQAGLNLFLAIISMLFLIGLVVMVFTLSSGNLQNSLATEDTLVTPAQLTGLVLNNTGEYTLSPSGLRGFKWTAVALYNGSDASYNLANITQTSTGLKSVNRNFTDAKLNYTYTWSANNSATDTMYRTTLAMKDSTSWFSTWIVLGALIVLVLLVVIVISAIRGSGLTGQPKGEGGLSMPKETA